MKNYKIRLAKIEDLEIINYFLGKMKQKDIDNERLASHPYERYYIYCFEGIDVGFLSLSCMIDRMELNYIYVNPLYRGKNIGSHLMDFIIEKANSEDFDNISLEVAVDNQAAIKLYVKYGFDTQAIREKYYNDSIDAILMVRWLKK